MTALILVDTNVILYSLDPVAPAKQARCAAWLKALAAAGSMVVSPQVCSETRVNAQRKLKLRPEIARRAAEDLLACCRAPLRMEEVARALALEARYKLSWWDALLMASAIAAGCSHLLTEDHQGVAEIEGVRLLHPFKTTPEQVLG